MKSLFRRFRLFVATFGFYSSAWATQGAGGNNITQQVGGATISSMPNVTAFLNLIAANINWMVGMGIIVSVGMTIIHLFFNQNESILKAIFKTVGGLVILKAAAYLVTLAVNQ